MQYKALNLLSFVAGAAAFAPATYDGFNLLWSDAFDGADGSSPNTANWNIVNGNNNANGELEFYTADTKNLVITAGATLQIIPYRDSTVNGGWTSGRIESSYTWTAQEGKVTRIESSLRFGTNDPSNKQGIWPAWWAIGDAIRHGVQWPSVGEIDVMEQVDGVMTGYGTLHCDVNPGGICNESNGLGANTPIPDNNFHIWRVDIDKTDSNWLNQSINWYLDGTGYHTILGSDIGDQTVWTAVANSPFYFILNVAVGGGFPGNPNDATLDGTGSMMEVGYVAHYST